MGRRLLRNAQLKHRVMVLERRLRRLERQVGKKAPEYRRHWRDRYTSSQATKDTWADFSARFDAEFKATQDILESIASAPIPSVKIRFNPLAGDHLSAAAMSAVNVGAETGAGKAAAEPSVWREFPWKTVLFGLCLMTAGFTYLFFECTK